MKTKIMNGDVFECFGDFVINKTVAPRRTIEGYFRRAGKKVRVVVEEIK